MFGVDRHAVVLTLAARADELPAALLLFQIQTCGIREEERRDEHACKTEPGDDVEFLPGGDVVVHDGCRQCSQFACGSRYAVGSSADRSWVDLGRNEKSDGVGPKLVEE